MSGSLFIQIVDVTYILKKVKITKLYVFLSITNIIQGYCHIASNPIQIKNKCNFIKGLAQAWKIFLENLRCQQINLQGVGKKG